MQSTGRHRTWNRGGETMAAPPPCESRLEDKLHGDPHWGGLQRHCRRVRMHVCGRTEAAAAAASCCWLASRCARRRAVSGLSAKLAPAGSCGWGRSGDRGRGCASCAAGAWPGPGCPAAPAARFRRSRTFIIWRFGCGGGGGCRGCGWRTPVG